MHLPFLIMSFNPCFNGFTILTAGAVILGEGMFWVSILVLMDSLFLHVYQWKDKYLGTCFNPCFNGFTILTRTFEKTLYLSMLQEFFQTLKSHFFD